MRCSQAFLLLLGLSIVSHDETYRISISGDHGNLIEGPASSTAKRSLSTPSTTRRQQLNSTNRLAYPQSGAGPKYWGKPPERPPTTGESSRRQERSAIRRKSSLGAIADANLRSGTGQQPVAPLNLQAARSTPIRVQSPRLYPQNFVRDRRAEAKRKRSLKNKKAGSKKRAQNASQGPSEALLDAAAEISDEPAATDLECCICYESPGEDVIVNKTPCGHNLCRECKEKGNFRQCPLCRQYLEAPLDIQVKSLHGEMIQIDNHPPQRGMIINGQLGWTIWQLKVEIASYSGPFSGTTARQKIYSDRLEQGGRELGDHDIVPSRNGKACVYLDFQDLASSSSSSRPTRVPSRTDLLPTEARYGQPRYDLPGAGLQRFSADIGAPNPDVRPDPRPMRPDLQHLFSRYGIGQDAPPYTSVTQHIRPAR